MNDALLAHTLERLRLRGTVYFTADFRAPWGMAVPAKSLAIFHVVVSGEAWLRTDGKETVCLSEGDILLLPHGKAHELVHAREGEAVPAETLLASPSKRAPVVYGGDGATTRLVCGHFSYDHAALHPLMDSLPDLVLLGSEQAPRAQWLCTAAELAAAQSARQQHSASVVVDRLAEALLLQTLRMYLEQHREERGYLAATIDPLLAPVLEALHADPARDWSVEEMSGIVHSSRAGFARRFRDVVGESPMHYLTRWRMLVARDLLVQPTTSLAQVAEAVGYSSEFAFAKAYKRTMGDTPGRARRRVSCA